MSSPASLILLALLILAQVVARPLLTVKSVAPDFFLMAIFFAAYRWGAGAGTATGFCLGLAQDSLAGRLFGLQALLKLSLGFVLGKSREWIYQPSWPLLFVVLLGAKGMHDLAYTFLFYGADLHAPFWSRVGGVVLESLYTALVGSLLFLVRDTWRR